MAHITVPDESTKTTFIVTTSQSIFSIPWTLFDKTDIQITVGGVALTQGDFTFAPNSDFEGGFNGGQVTLNTPVSSTTVIIWRKIITARTEDFGAGPVSARDRNTALDRLTAMAQDARRDLDDMHDITVGPEGPAGADGVGLPAGGTTGQIPKKQSNADYDIAWEDDDGSGTTIAAATEGSPGVGDFIPYLTAADAPGKVEGDYYAVAATVTSALAAKADASAVTSALAGKQDTSTIAEVIRDTIGATLVQGSNITITVNDAGDTITIAAAGGGEASQLLPRSGAWLASGSGANSAAIMGSSGRIFYVPLIVPAACTIDRIGIHVQTGDAGTNAKLGIYGSTAARLPGSLIAACASPVSTATSGAKEGTFSVNPTLAAGLYWLAWQTDSSGFTLQPKIIANSTLVWMENSLGTANYVGEIDIAAIEVGTYASGLPATAAAPTINLGGGWFSPCMSVRVA